MQKNYDLEGLPFNSPILSPNKIHRDPNSLCAYKNPYVRIILDPLSEKQICNIFKNVS